MAYNTAAEARQNYWFSRKFKTNEVHSNNSDANKTRWAEKFNSALFRQKQSAKMSPADRLKALDNRLGKGLGAKRERAKLTLKVENIRIAEANKVRKAESKKVEASKK